jgi:hypothetical protein
MTVRYRTPKEQEQLTRKLVECGVSAIPAYQPRLLSGPTRSVEYGWSDGETLASIISSPTAERGLVDGVVMRHYELITLAHDHSIVIGDRWPGNAIVGSDASVALIDFELEYVGDFGSLSLFEETFSIVQSLVYVADLSLMLDLRRRLLQSLELRHGEAVADTAFESLRRFYLGCEWTPNVTSPARTHYADVFHAWSMPEHAVA